MSDDIVAISNCDTYDKNKIKENLRELISITDGFSQIVSGMHVGIKANLVAAGKPETAVATHPSVITALSELLNEIGAKVTVGDSAGGPWTAAYMEHIYNVCGMKGIENNDVILNRNFSERDVTFPEGKVCRSFRYTAWLDSCDVIINVCKLKSHGMMGLSNASKNLFGVVPGTIKPEYHFRYSNPNDFADMILDIGNFVKPVLHICDAVIAMQGNGPTKGDPYPMNMLIVSKDPHKLDWVAASLIGMDIEDVPTLQAAKRRGYLPEHFSDITIIGQIGCSSKNDFQIIKNHNSLLFTDDSTFLGKIERAFLTKALSSKPIVRKKDCIGCKKCETICPAKAIKMKNEKPYIDRKKCIKCFCCQEFCPKGAMKVHRAKIASLVTH